jgi:hypothetical protein
MRCITTNTGKSRMRITILSALFFVVPANAAVTARVTSPIFESNVAEVLITADDCDFVLDSRRR